MSQREYPRIGEIRQVQPQGMCGLCKCVLYDGHKPDRVIIVQITYMRGDDEPVKAHSECIQAAGDKLLKRLMNN